MDQRQSQLKNLFGVAWWTTKPRKVSRWFCPCRLLLPTPGFGSFRTLRSERQMRRWGVRDGDWAMPGLWIRGIGLICYHDIQVNYYNKINKCVHVSCLFFVFFIASRFSNSTSNLSGWKKFLLLEEFVLFFLVRRFPSSVVGCSEDLGRQSLQLSQRRGSGIRGRLGV